MATASLIVYLILTSPITAVKRFLSSPRCGLNHETLRLVQLYRRILYMSCNPQTLSENLSTLTQTHRVERLELFDQFPNTHHMECGLLLTRFGRGSLRSGF